MPIARDLMRSSVYRIGNPVSLPSIIAVDGPAGSGKSSVSFAVAQRIGYLFVDTGAFYRAITLLALERQIDPRTSEQVVELAHNAQFDMTPDLKNDGRQFTFLADGIDITTQLHNPQVDDFVSVVAADRNVRTEILDLQRRLATRGKVIMAGRDIGSVVLPDADLKIYIDATLDKRAERRYQQRIANNEPADLAAIRDGLRRRDEIDSTRDVAPLRRPDDAIYLDTTELSLPEAIDATHTIIVNWRGSKSG